MRNCTRDEGRSFEVDNQVLISSHRKLLLSKAMVVNVAATSGQFRQARLREASASEPLQRTKEISFTAGMAPVKVDPNGQFEIEQMYVQYFKLASPKFRY